MELTKDLLSDNTKLEKLREGVRDELLCRTWSEEWNAAAKPMFTNRDI